MKQEKFENIKDIGLAILIASGIIAALATTQRHYRRWVVASAGAERVLIVQISVFCQNVRRFFQGKYSQVSCETSRR
jgi:tagatose-1,6-bisphosphate aldolase